MGIVDKQRHGVSKQLSDLTPDEDAALKTWLESDAPKYLHGAKAAWHMLRGRGITLRGIAHDTAIAAYLLRPGQRTYDLADVYQRHLQRPAPPRVSSTASVVPQLVAPTTATRVIEP